MQEGMRWRIAEFEKLKSSNWDCNICRYISLFQILLINNDLESYKLWSGAGIIYSIIPKSTTWWHPYASGKMDKNKCNFTDYERGACKIYFQPGLALWIIFRLMVIVAPLPPGITGRLFRLSSFMCGDSGSIYSDVKYLIT